MAAPSESKSSAEKSAGTGTGNSNPRTFLPLSHLTAQSARVGLWEVMNWNPKDTTHEYLWEGKQRTSHGFQCTLISTNDPKEYVLADSHGKGMTAQITKALLAKFKPGLVFAMSKVVLAENSKRQYNSAPKTEIVCLHQTKFDPVLTGSIKKSAMPEPPVPIAASMSINHEQHFDALALIQDISETAPGGQLKDGQARTRFTVTLIDGSTNKDEKKPRLLPLTIFASTPPDGSDPSIFQEFRDAFHLQEAVAFFNIQGKKSQSTEGSTWSFQSGYDLIFT